MKYRKVSKRSTGKYNESKYRIKYRCNVGQDQVFYVYVISSRLGPSLRSPTRCVYIIHLVRECGFAPSPHSVLVLRRVSGHVGGWA